MTSVQILWCPERFSLPSILPPLFTNVTRSIGGAKKRKVNCCLTYNGCKFLIVLIKISRQKNVFVENPFAALCFNATFCYREYTVRLCLNFLSHNRISIYYLLNTYKVGRMPNEITPQYKSL